MKRDYEVIVIGAGPAGMAAAKQAAALGLDVAVLDEQDVPGGQIYREVEAAAGRTSGGAQALGPDYAHGAALVEAFRTATGVDYRPGTSVWEVDARARVACTDAAGTHMLQARHIISATGALERPVPVPGWTLPGVMGAAGAQVLLKTAGLVPEGPVVLAGSGPLLLLIASDLVKAGAQVAALVQTTRRSDYLAAAPHLPRALRGWSQLKRGLAMRSGVRAAGVAVYEGATGLGVLGSDAAEGLAFTAGGRQHQVPATAVLLHDGVVPDTQLTRQVGCEHRWERLQRYWAPVLDAWGRTSVDFLTVAGDSGGVNGARAAEVQGSLAALNVATLLGRLPALERDTQAAPLRRELAVHLAPRPMLDRLFRPRIAQGGIPDDVVVCRCEEVTARDIRRAVADGGLGPNQVKAYTRAGMGPCQGRFCGLTVAELVAAELGTTAEAVGTYRIRPPLKPVTLAQLAALELPPDVPPAEERRS